MYRNSYVYSVQRTVPDCRGRRRRGSSRARGRTAGASSWCSRRAAPRCSTDACTHKHNRTIRFVRFVRGGRGIGNHGEAEVKAESWELIPTGAREHLARHVRRAARRIVPLGHLLAIVPTHRPLRYVAGCPLVRRSRRWLRAVPIRATHAYS